MRVKSLTPPLPSVLPMTAITSSAVNRPAARHASRPDASCTLLSSTFATSMDIALSDFLRSGSFAVAAPTVMLQPGCSVSEIRLQFPALALSCAFLRAAFPRNLRRDQSWEAARRGGVRAAPRAASPCAQHRSQVPQGSQLSTSATPYSSRAAAGDTLPSMTSRATSSGSRSIGSPQPPPPVVTTRTI